MVNSSSILDTARHNKQKESVTMEYTNYKQAPNAVAQMLNFKGNTMSGWWLDSSQYVVFSYAKEIGRYDRLTDKLTINAEKYSVTTSRHQNIVRRAWGL